MSNPFSALDFSDDENITVVKPVVAKPQKEAGKNRKELLQEEEDLRQKKKGSSAIQGNRGNQPQPDVAHPGERSKIGLKKDPHVATHKQPANGGERRGRQFERHSGTGRGREIKKGGAGGGNWGKPGDEAAPLPSTTPEAREHAEEEPVEEDPSLTLEEYEALKAAKRSGAAFEVKEARKVAAPVEGKAYKKGDDDSDADYIKLGTEPEAKAKSTHVKSKGKQVFDVDIKFRDVNADSAPRRGRPEGGARGGGSFRGRDDRPARGGAAAPRGGRGGRAPGPASTGSINTADQSAFPKLGA